MAARVLICDDEVDLADELGDLVRTRGWEPQLFCDVRSAVEWLRGGNKAQAIVTDIRMPEVSGIVLIEECSRVRASGDPDCCRRIVAITGHQSNAENRILVDRGADAVLNKPFDFDELLDLIEPARPAG